MVSSGATTTNARNGSTHASSGPKAVGSSALAAAHCSSVAPGKASRLVVSSAPDVDERVDLEAADRPHCRAHRSGTKR